MLRVADNASDDDTPDVVASFGDPRIVYMPVEQNIGRPQNFNRLIEAAETEFVVLLCDDDRLFPDHLALTVDALKRWPHAGVAHTGCVIVDHAGETIDPHSRLVRTNDSVVIEAGGRFLVRSMKMGSMVCWSSAMFRTEAVAGTGGLRPEDGALDDLGLMMRIATRWDFAYVNQPLAVMRAHSGADSSELGSFTPRGFRSSRELADVLHRCRQNFLVDADLPERETAGLTKTRGENTPPRPRTSPLDAGEHRREFGLDLAGATARDPRRPSPRSDPGYVAVHARPAWLKTRARGIEAVPSTRPRLVSRQSPNQQSLPAVRAAWSQRPSTILGIYADRWCRTPAVSP